MMAARGEAAGGNARGSITGAAVGVAGEYADNVLRQKAFEQENPDVRFNCDPTKTPAWSASITEWDGKETAVRRDDLGDLLTVLEQIADDRNRRAAPGLQRLMGVWGDFCEDFRYEGGEWLCRLRSGNGTEVRADTEADLDDTLRTLIAAGDER